MINSVIYSCVLISRTLIFEKIHDDIKEISIKLNFIFELPYATCAFEGYWRAITSLDTRAPHKFDYKITTVSSQFTETST